MIRDPEGGLSIDMNSWHCKATVPGSPNEVLELLTEPEAIARWAPVPFKVLALDGARLQAGSRARVAGSLVGRSVEFEIDVLRASDDRLELVAEGPISIDVRYRLQEAGSSSQIEASIGVEGRGLFGRVMAKATEALMAGGALRVSLDRLGRELQPAVAA
jgi:hypothetical protein